MNYYNKYIKYKSKYLDLKYVSHTTSHVGGNKLIIHISGPSGAGKTTLGNKLRSKFGNNIVVKDLDDLRAEFIKKEYGTTGWKIKSFNKNKYQLWIDNYISKQRKPIILTGLNHI